MASIANDPGGRKRILFFDADGQRKAIRLGKMSQRQAESVKVRVEALAAAQITGTAPDDETSRWVAKRDETLRDRLAAVGLIDPPKRATLGPFVADYIAKRKPLVKPGTLQGERQTESCLLAFFGADKRLKDISEGDAVDFRNYLLTIGGAPVKRCGPVDVKRPPTALGEATTRKRCSIAGKMFRYAIRHKLIASNPFEAVPRSGIATKHRAYIDAATAKAVLDELPTTEWKLLFALSRWGGLRVGSEVRRLTWNDIDWEGQRLLIHSPKTEHHAGRETRMLPIFPELAPWLDKRYAEAADGDTLILPMLAGRSDAALRKTLERAIKRAGATQWPRLWHNLRGTRQTELENEFPTHVVCAWLGNSEAVAREHYLQVTDEHFAKASGELLRRSDKAAQNQAQSAHGSNEQRLTAEQRTAEFAGSAKRGQSSSRQKAVGEGLLHPGQSSGKTAKLARGGAKSGALAAPNDDLALIAARWPELSPHVKATILGMVGSGGPKGAKR